MVAYPDIICASRLTIQASRRPKKGVHFGWTLIWAALLFVPFQRKRLVRAVRCWSAQLHLLGTA